MFVLKDGDIAPLALSLPSRIRKSLIPWEEIQPHVIIEVGNFLDRTYRQNRRCVCFHLEISTHLPFPAFWLQLGYLSHPRTRPSPQSSTVQLSDLSAKLTRRSRMFLE